jgi:hypothetical protein
MSKAYLITYDLKTPGRDYAKLYEAIKASQKWWHYLESCWVIVTDENPTQIWNRLAPAIDNSDRLLVIEVRDSVQGWLPKDAWDWIHSNVPKP